MGSAAASAAGPRGSKPAAGIAGMKSKCETVTQPGKGLRCTCWEPGFSYAAPASCQILLDSPTCLTTPHLAVVPPFPQYRRRNLDPHPPADGQNYKPVNRPVKAWEHCRVLSCLSLQGESVRKAAEQQSPQKKQKNEAFRFPCSSLFQICLQKTQVKKIK